ncbi:glycoside hydrolase, family 71 [Aspergillus udagawae]|uniref:Glycoside hydrolase, family 71 n=1 Tax=Aspergillus udagawae TaxID=91492 RepID=A0ABQ1BA51_9EURO|nr:glycoside hydrolase, family 71 [Aspergillus udagawae]GFF56526.1 glycoside hydrolase, family 71 [Aspergillus udagawae]GFF97184.1 glycoside hydrolase, family 71 [Aspergillus udagawae]
MKTATATLEEEDWFAEKEGSRCVPLLPRLHGVHVQDGNRRRRTNPIDDCGLYGCGGGCSIQSCDQSCGVACSTDQHHLDSDSTGSSGGGGGGGSDSGSSSSGGSAGGQQANLPMDYDGPMNLANGKWNPTPILVEDAAAAMSGLSAIMAQATPCFESALSLLTATQTIPADLYSTVQASATFLKQSMSTQISDLKDKINAADPVNFQAVTP